MAEPRDTVIDIEPPADDDWDKPTPTVPALPASQFLLGAVDAHNVWFKYLQSSAWKLVGDDGKPRRITAEEAADIVQTVRGLQGV
jgi:hypothetical protein